MSPSRKQMEANAYLCCPLPYLNKIAEIHDLEPTKWSTVLLYPCTKGGPGELPVSPFFGYDAVSWQQV